VAYGYDAANRLTSVTDWNLATTSYAYDDAGRMTSATLPSSTGVVSTYTYDNADRLLGISHDKGLNTLASVDYTLDAVGNRTQRVDQLGTHTYAYDDLYRLTSVTYPGPSTTGYAFDAFGNRTSMTTGAGTTTYAYDDADRLTSVTPPGQSAISYTWDDNGNLTGRGTDTFSWDYNDRMVAATIGGVSSSFAYLGDGLRNSRTVGSTTTVFTWDIAGGLPPVLDDGNQYVYGAGLLSQISAAGTYYYLADGLGSTMKTVDSSGVVVNEYEYDVYGTLRSSSGSQANEFQFAGQQTDPTGLQYLRARYYDMETGRFISRDPMAAAQAWKESAFAYADANVVNVTDPLGLCGIKVWQCGDDLVGGIKDGASEALDKLKQPSVWKPLLGVGIIIAADIPAVVLTAGCVMSAGILCPIAEVYDVAVMIPATLVGLCLISGGQFDPLGMGDSCSHNSSGKREQRDESGGPERRQGVEFTPTIGEKRWLIN